MEYGIVGDREDGDGLTGREGSLDESGGIDAIEVVDGGGRGGCF